MKFRTAMASAAWTWAWAGLALYLPAPASATRVNVNGPARGASVAARNVGDANVNRNVNRSAGVSDGTVNANRNVNRNINHNVNVDVDNHHDYHPFATAAAFTTGVALTSAVVGSMAYSLPPSCSSTVVNGIGYQQCGSAWYQPQYSGSAVTYVVVNPPR